MLAFLIVYIGCALPLTFYGMKYMYLLNLDHSIHFMLEKWAYKAKAVAKAVRLLKAIS